MRCLVLVRVGRGSRSVGADLFCGGGLRGRGGRACLVGAAALELIGVQGRRRDLAFWFRNETYGGMCKAYLVLLGVYRLLGRVFRGVACW